MPALESLFFSRVAQGARVLDLCCGSGHVTKELTNRGYRVTGVDLSSALIERARKNLPTVEFLVQDARTLHLNTQYDAALSTFDSLNHMLTLEDLRDVFTRVRAHLKSNGHFVFDMNSEAAYFVDLRQWIGTVNNDDVGLVRGTYDALSKTARTELLWFQKQQGTDLWTKSESIVEQRCYTETEIMTALFESGFSNVEAVSAEDVGVTADLGFGRIFYTARP